MVSGKQLSRPVRPSIGQEKDGIQGMAATGAPSFFEEGETTSF